MLTGWEQTSGKDEADVWMTRYTGGRNFAVLDAVTTFFSLSRRSFFSFLLAAAQRLQSERKFSLLLEF